MTKKEFLEIKEKFEKEEERWESIKIGDTVIQAVPRYFDYDLYDIVVSEVNVDERYIIGYDTSQDNKVVKLYGFYTEKEFEESKSFLL